MNQTTETEPRQDQLADLVGREVVQCISYLVSELSQDEKYMDELMAVQTQNDWREAAHEEVYYSMCISDCKDWLEENTDKTLPDDYENHDKLKDMVWDELLEQDEFEMFTNERGIDPHTSEALEHWIVSPWFARKLEENGEMVLHDFMGLTIWGRTCSGQAILLDGVTTSIWKSIQ